MKATSACLLALALMILSSAHDAHAADKPKAVKYVAPAGFDGRLWGELRTSPGFSSLPERPIGVGAAFMQPVETDLYFTCMPPSASEISMGGADPGSCDPWSTLNSYRRKVEGGGIYVLSEYTIEEQGARLGGEANGVLLYPVVYQFCANWDGRKLEVPPTFDEVNQFCGVRMMFKSEMREELRDLPSDHETRYDRVLDLLVAKYGKPQNFRQRGQVLIESDGPAPERKERRFGTWRWCPASVGSRGLHTRCAASVVLSLDRVTGVGIVLYSAPVLWEYAYARENNGFKGDGLYRVLQARQ